MGEAVFLNRCRAGYGLQGAGANAGVLAANEGEDAAALELSVLWEELARVPRWPRGAWTVAELAAHAAPGWRGVEELDVLWTACYKGRARFCLACVAVMTGNERWAEARSRELLRDGNEVVVEAWKEVRRGTGRFEKRRRKEVLPRSDDTLAESCRKVPRDLQDFKRMVTTCKNFDALLTGSQSLHLMDRIGLAVSAIQDDSVLLDWIDREHDSAVERGDLFGLLVSRTFDQVAAILNAFVKRTSDIQTAALISCMIPLVQLRSLPLVGEYREFLLKHELNADRVELDLAIAWTDKPPTDRRTSESDQFTLEPRCYYCNKSLRFNELGPTRSFSRGFRALSVGQLREPKCANCARRLPRCAVCLTQLEMANPTAERSMANSKSGNLVLPVANGTVSAMAPYSKSPSAIPYGQRFSWCLQCGHGGHANHMSQWFAGHRHCPVSNCECTCTTDAGAVETVVTPDARVTDTSVQV